MSNDHMDFYLGTGPDARWLGSLAELGGPVTGPAPEPPAEASVEASADVDLAAVFATENADSYEAAVVGLLAHRAAQGVFAVMPGPVMSGSDGQPGWPWRAATSVGWYACTFNDGRARLSIEGGPWSASGLASLPGGREFAGPPADLPVLADTAPRTARFTYTVQGFSIPITQTMPPVSPTYLARRAEAEAARAVAGAAELVVRRRWPLADLNVAAIREIVRGLLRPGPGPHVHALLAHAPFAYERVMAALQYLVDADRYAENNNPDHGATLLASAAEVAAQAVTAHRTHQPYPWPPRGYRTKGP